MGAVNAFLNWMFRSARERWGTSAGIPKFLRAAVNLFRGVLDRSGDLRATRDGNDEGRRSPFLNTRQQLRQLMLYWRLAVRNVSP